MRTASLAIRVAVVVGLCACGPSYERTFCLDHCRDQDNRCVLGSHRAEELDHCARETDRCLASCPSR
ncbi:MAG: hypothetical protein JJ863_28125 [Deltaproteobacteria bacterium]|nr:hypothetical protein [Deltaproteobacteria bacterium]